MLCRTWAVAALSICPITVFATSCIADRSTLAARYAAADAIAIAQANSCKGALLANNFRCPGEEYQFSVLEVLKDVEPARDLSGTYHGEDFMGCGLVFRNGNHICCFLMAMGRSYILIAVI